MTAVQCFAALEGQVCLFSTVSPLKAQNEDGAAFIPIDEKRGVLAVADGVGGLPGGEVASSMALQSLVHGVASANGIAREGILQGIENANRQIQASGDGPATTLAVVEILDRGIRTYHVGDSEILICHSNAGLRWKSLPHSPVGYGVESGLLDPRDAIFHEARHLVSNVVGGGDASIEMSTPLDLTAQDTVLLATDGLFDNLHLEEVVERMVIPDLKNAGLQLVELAQRRMAQPGDHPSKPDDLTVMLYRRSS